MKRSALFAIYFLAVFLMILSSLSFANDNLMREFIEKIDNIQSMEGKFKQIVRDQDGEEIQATEGDFKVKRPGMFYWQVSPPFEQLVIGNIDALAVYDEDLGQATIYSNRALDNTPALILSGHPEAIAADYSVTNLNEEKNTYELSPIDAEESAFDSLSFTFKGKKIKSLRFIDKLGQATDVSFSRLKLNREIDESVFVFIPPPGTDVIINE